MNVEIINILLDQRMNGQEDLAYEIIEDWKNLLVRKNNHTKEFEEMKVTFFKLTIAI